VCVCVWRVALHEPSGQAGNEPGSGGGEGGEGGSDVTPQRGVLLRRALGGGGGES
jgi:hypothetical protein